MDDDTRNMNLNQDSQERNDDDGEREPGTSDYGSLGITPLSAPSIHQYPEAMQLLVTMDDDTRNMNLSQDSQEKNDDVTEEEVEKSCIQALKVLVTKADTEIDELEKDLVCLQIELASCGCEHWLNEFYNALRDHVDWLEMALVGLRNNIMSPIEARRRLYREPAKKLPVILNALMARLSGSGMGTDEFDNPHVTPPSAPCVHQYPEVIMAAIEALNEPKGSNKTTIFKHLESTYGKLPAAHNTLLSKHLTKLKNSGQLVFVKNNYRKPDANAPPQRGRCPPPKPPKPKNPLSSAAALSSGFNQTHSRTLKARDYIAPVSQPKKVYAGSGRPLSRPRKGKPVGTSSPPSGEPEISREREIPTRRRLSWRPLKDFY